METKICAYCGQEIKKEEYRVYCPSCHADYHKDCWLANNGCVTEGCEYNRRPTGICPYCHTPTKKEYAYCKKCGRPTNPLMNLVVYPEGSEYFVPDTEADTAVMLAGENSEKIMKSFAKMQKTKYKLSWNTPAFLFTGFWFIYRKMLAQGLAVLLLFALLVSSFAFFPGMRFLSVPLMLILWVGCGVCGNGIYMEHLRKVSGAALNVPQNLRLEYIFREGGVDKKKTVIAALISAAAALVFLIIANAVI